MKNAFPVAAVLLGISTSLLAQGSGLKISGEMDAGIQNGVVAQMPVAAEVGSGDERDELGSG